MSQQEHLQSDFRPAFLPYFRHAWIIPATVAAALGLLLHLGFNVAIPFTTMLVVIVISSLMAGRLSGFLSGLTIVLLGTYVYLFSIGTPPLLNSLKELVMGSVISIGLGLLLGSLRATLESAVAELETRAKQVVRENETLSRRVSKNTEELDSVTRRLDDSQERLRSATRRLIDAQESDRRKLAKELHDDIGQSLTALRINLESNKRNFARDATSLNFIETSYRLVDEIIASVRELSLNLRPSLLDDLGLIAAVREYVSKYLKREDISLNFEVKGSDEKIEATHSIAAYRIVQEIITNIIKHSSAGHVDVLLSIEERGFSIEIRDNGVGFSVDLSRSDQVGLASVRERASLLGGSVEVESRIGQGTAVIVRIPNSVSVDKDAAA